MTYRDPQYLFGKISTKLTYIISIQRTKRISNIGFHSSKWPHLHSAYLVIGWYSSLGPLQKFLVKSSILVFRFWLKTYFLSRKDNESCYKRSYYYSQVLSILFTPMSVKFIIKWVKVSWQLTYSFVHMKLLLGLLVKGNGKFSKWYEVKVPRVLDHYWDL